MLDKRYKNEDLIQASKYFIKIYNFIVIQKAKGNNKEKM